MTRKILAVANRTADSPNLIAALRERAGGGQASFTLLVPAVTHDLAGAVDLEAGWAEAMSRADRAGTRVRQAGLELEETIVGDPDPFVAVGDVLHVREFDEIVFEEEPAREAVAV